MAAMLIREHPAKILDGDTTYVVRIFGEDRAAISFHRLIGCTSPPGLEEEHRQDDAEQGIQTTSCVFCDGI